jgi:hypothetical protein
MNIKEKIKIIDGRQFCHCAKHNDFLPCEEFHKDNTKKHKHRSSCIECDRIGKIPEDYTTKHAKIILSKLGYNVKSKIPIWQQFLIKHDL